LWHPLSLPEDYHTAARGQRRTTHGPVLLRAAPGLPCGRAAPGRRDATQPQRARPSVLRPLLRSLVKKAPDKETGVRRPSRLGRGGTGLGLRVIRHLRRSPVVPTGEALARVLSAALHQQAQTCRICLTSVARTQRGIWSRRQVGSDRAHRGVLYNPLRRSLRLRIFEVLPSSATAGPSMRY
jgi:hypothetical protein